MKTNRRERVPQSACQMELQPPALKDVNHDLRECGFECIFGEWHGQNLYSLHVRLRDGAQVLVVAAGRAGIKPADYGRMGAEVFTVEAITPHYLAARAVGAADKFAIAGSFPHPPPPRRE